MKKKKNQFIIFATLLLAFGFSAVSLFSYFVANKTINEQILSNSLPLTSDNIYSEIQRDILPTIIISSLMAQDTFVRDWVNQGEIDSDKITRYLKSIQARYNTATAFFISDKTYNYYHSSGLLRKVSVTMPADGWYFKVHDLKTDFEINLDTDTANRRQTNIFVNHKMFDQQGDYLGVIGVGLSSETVIKMIEHYRVQYNREVYFIEPDGKIVLGSSQNQQADNISQIEGLSLIAPQVLSTPSGSFEYPSQSNVIYLKSRFVPELNWYLLVEQIEKTEEKIQNTLWINLSFSLFITILVIILVSLTLGKYQQRLEIMATQDELTGIDNRHAFDISLQYILKESERNKTPLSFVIADIDFFKKINDLYGHSAGDKVLIKTAAILKNGLRDSDLLCRWGGEEFLILLPDCELNQAKNLIEKIRCQIETNHVILDKNNIAITASFGISEYRIGESQQSVFERVDKALYHAKENGRNRVESL